MHAVIAHCWTGCPSAGWYPALAAELEKLGFSVSVPLLPDSDDPDPRAWHQAIDSATGKARHELVLIGHSLGALAALRWLSTVDRPVAGAVLVAPPTGPTGLPVIERFAVPDLPSALAAARRALVVVSDRDAYLLPAPHAVAQAFTGAGARQLIVPGKGHFSPRSGLASLPEINPFLAEMAHGIRAGELHYQTLLKCPARE